MPGDSLAPNGASIRPSGCLRSIGLGTPAESPFDQYRGCPVYDDHGACICSTGGHGACAFDGPSVHHYERVTVARILAIHHALNDDYPAGSGLRDDNRADCVDPGSDLRGRWLGRFVRTYIPGFARHQRHQLVGLRGHLDTVRDSADRRGTSHPDTTTRSIRLLGLVKEAT